MLSLARGTAFRRRNMPLCGAIISDFRRDSLAVRTAFPAWHVGLRSLHVKPTWLGFVVAHEAWPFVVWALERPRAALWGNFGRHAAAGTTGCTGQAISRPWVGFGADDARAGPMPDSCAFPLSSLREH